jgi:hypothetical protein
MPPSALHQPASATTSPCHAYTSDEPSVSRTHLAALLSILSACVGRQMDALFSVEHKCSKLSCTRLHFCMHTICSVKCLEHELMLLLPLFCL